MEKHIVVLDMIIYGFIRNYLPKGPAILAATLIYCLLWLLIFISISQVGADLRYANL